MEHRKSIAFVCAEQTRNKKYCFFNINGLVDSGCAHTKQKDKEELNCLQSVKHPCRSTKTTQPS